MMAVLAANSVVGAGLGVGVSGVSGREVSSGMATSAVGVALFAEGNVGKAFTGIITTFLNEDKKSRFAACLFMPDMKKDSVFASCSESSFSQAPTSSLHLFVK